MLQVVAPLQQRCTLHGVPCVRCSGQGPYVKLPQLAVCTINSKDGAIAVAVSSSRGVAGINHLSRDVFLGRTELLWIDAVMLNVTHPIASQHKSHADMQMIVLACNTRRCRCQGIVCVHQQTNQARCVAASKQLDCRPLHPGRHMASASAYTCLQLAAVCHICHDLCTAHKSSALQLDVLQLGVQDIQRRAHNVVRVQGAGTLNLEDESILLEPDVD